VDRCPSNLPIIEQSSGWVEVLTGPERRRRWSADEKARIVAESLAPGAVGSAAARRYGIHRNQLYGWRRELLPAKSGSAVVAPEFVPIAVMAECGGSTGVEIVVADMVAAIRLLNVVLSSWALPSSRRLSPATRFGSPSRRHLSENHSATPRTS